MVQYIWYNIYGAIHTVQCIWYNTYGTIFLVQCMVQYIWYSVYGTMYMVQYIWYIVYGTIYNQYNLIAWMLHRILLLFHNFQHLIFALFNFLTIMSERHKKQYQAICLMRWTGLCPLLSNCWANGQAVRSLATTLQYWYIFVVFCKWHKDCISNKKCSLSIISFIVIKSMRDIASHSSL
jgi:hypothetical protein